MKILRFKEGIGFDAILIEHWKSQKKTFYIYVQDDDKGCYVRHYGKRYKGVPRFAENSRYFTYENFGPTVDFYDEDDLYYNEIEYDSDEIRVNQVLIEKIEKNRENYPEVTIVEIDGHELCYGHEVVTIDGRVILEDISLDEKIRVRHEEFLKRYDEYMDVRKISLK